MRSSRIEPGLPSPTKAPPAGPDWLHEIKHDGFSILARRDAKGVRLYYCYQRRKANTTD